MMDASFWTKWLIIAISIAGFAIWLRWHSRNEHEKRMDALAKRERKRMI